MGKSSKDSQTKKKEPKTTKSNGTFQRGQGRRSSTQLGKLPTMPNYTEPVTFHYEIQNHTGRMQKITKAFRVYRLTVSTITCVLVGILLGLICRLYSGDWSERQFMYIEFPGELYLRLLKLMIVPLLVSNVILSFGSIQGKLSSHLGKLASVLYLMSNLVAILVAIVLVLLIKPGKRAAAGTATFEPGSGGIHGILGPQGTRAAGFGEQMQFDNHNQLTNYDDHYNGISSASSGNSTSIIVFNSSSGPMNQVGPASLAPSNQILPTPMTLYLSKIINNGSSAESINNYNRTSIEPIPERHKKPKIDHGVGGGGHHVTDEELVRRPIVMNSVDQKQPEIHGGVDGKTHHVINIDSSHIKDSRHPVYNFDGDNRRIGVSTNIPIDILLDILRNLIPDNLIASVLHQTKSRLLAPTKMVIGVNGTTEPPPARWPIIHENVEQANIIGLLAISVLTGVVLSHMGEAGKPLLELCACISELSLRIGMMAINLTPFCIMFLLIGQVARTRDLSSTLNELIKYLATVISALILHGCIIMPALYWAITKKSPIGFLHHLLDVLVASFATSSSSATLALLVSSLLQYNLNPVIVRAFAPLGSVFNMNGTTIYEIIGCIFLAQTVGVDLPFSSILLVGLASAVAGLSTVGVPSSGMMTIVIVLDAINLPTLPLSLIYIVDFIVDRFRTVVNVWTGAIICALIDHWCPERLFDEATEHRKFLDIMKMRPAGKQDGSLKNSPRDTSSSVDTFIVGSISESLDIGKSNVISVTITPPPPENTNV